MENSNPFELIEHLFLTHTNGKPFSTLSDPNAFPSSIISTQFSPLINHNNVPSLNTRTPHTTADSIQPNTLVRLRCMVQDIYNPEYYPGAFEEITPNGERSRKTGIGRDALAAAVNGNQIDQSNAVVWERHPLYCVPIPGESIWVQELFNQVPKEAAPQVASTAKRVFETGEEINEDTTTSNDINSDSSSDNHNDNDSDNNNNENSDLKRSKNVFPFDSFQSSSSSSSSSTSTPTFLKDQNNSTTHITNNNNNNNNNNDSNGTNNANFVNHNFEQAGFVVKVYDSEEMNLKATDCIELVGILAPFLPRDPTDDDLMDDAIPRLVPHIHCLSYRKLEAVNFFEGALVSQVNNDILLVREQLVSWLASSLGGDRLAAEYLILNLVSRVTARHGLMCVGNLSVNFTNFPASSLSPATPASKLVQNLISAILPKSIYLPLSLHTLNNTTLTPRKNYSTNIMESGFLQLSPGTHLMIDETALEAGKLVQQGLDNLGILKDLILTQKIQYDFEYYKSEFPTDIPVVVISESRSVLQCDCVVPVTVTPQHHLGAPISMPPFPQLQQFRAYLAYVRDISLAPPSDEVSKRAQEDFVNARKNNSEVTQGTFHLWLTIARLLAQSYGETQLNQERWLQALNLEYARVNAVQAKK
eukprot:TRINITY_DN2260_c0_g3_i2.p1 TRINITY_DN2260_c0_g3~~TRINITY_DN2260_c0_g3_i2.p1  ORF type:complete len:644 (-),score=131.64 TRINITY_DN2260_c0_g3_i2:44-1975(-)